MDHTIHQSEECVVIHSTRTIMFVLELPVQKIGDQLRVLRFPPPKKMTAMI
jgi:hypothetical protein